MMKSTRWSLVVVALAGLASVGAGAVIGLSTASASPAPAASPTVQQDSATSAAYVFPKNAYGQTYGSELDAATPGDAPDLIRAYATNGREGYVLKTDLHPPLTGGMDEALALNSSGDRAIPVYEVDGRTVIGEFVIAAPNSEGGK